MGDVSFAKVLDVMEIVERERFLGKHHGRVDQT